MNIQAILSDKISAAMLAAGAPEGCDALVRQSAKAQFGDYQANGVMGAAKKMGMPPRQLAEQIVSQRLLVMLPRVLKNLSVIK